MSMLIIPWASLVLRGDTRENGAHTHDGGAECSVATRRARHLGHLPYLPMTRGEATAAFPTLSRAFPSIVQHAQMRSTRHIHVSSA